MALIQISSCSFLSPEIKNSLKRNFLFSFSEILHKCVSLYIKSSIISCFIDL